MKIYNELEAFKKAIENKSGRILSLDLGTKKIGLAICDDTYSIITPKLVLRRQNNQTDFKKITSIIEESQVIALVIGFPINLDGSECPMTHFVERFVDNFKNFWQGMQKNELPTILWDERLSSFEARNKMAEIPMKKKFNDDIAAAVILEHFLNDLRNC